MKLHTKIGKNDRYELLSKLGAGGMGVVFRARDSKLDREVAIKFIKNEDSSRTISQRFAREARMMASLNHPNLLKIFELELQSTPPYIVSECLEGCDLADLVDSGHILNKETGKRLATDLASALTALHEKNIVHRDIKMANIFQEKIGRFKLLDLGLARPVEETRLTGVGGMVGTLNYMPPEVLRGYDATTASDVYQFGLVLHEALTGEQLQGLEGGNKLAPNMIDLDLWGAREPNKDLPKAFRELISQCCAKDFKKRPKDGSALLRLIDKLLPQKTTTIEPRSIQTAALAVVEKETTNTKAQDKVRTTPTAIFTVTMLLLLAYALWPVSQKPAASVTKRKLFNKAKEWLLLPEEIVLVMPLIDGSLSWRLELENNASYRGKFIKSSSELQAVIGRPPSVNKAILKVYANSELLGKEIVEFPKEVFRKEPTARFGFGDVAVSWLLHGKVNCLVNVELPERKLIVAQGSSKSGYIHLTAQGLRRGERDLRWTLSYKDKVHAQGKGQIGPSERGSINTKSIPLDEAPARCLAPAIVFKNKLLTIHSPDLLTSWHQAESANGTVLQVKWQRPFPFSIGEDPSLIAYAGCFLNNLVLCVNKKSRFLMDLDDITSDSKAKVKVVPAQMMTGQGVCTNLNSESFLAAVPIVGERVSVELFDKPNQNEINSFEFAGVEVYALTALDKNHALLCYRSNQGNNLAYLKIEDGRLSLMKTRVLGPAPATRKGFPSDGPPRSLITSFLDQERTLVAYDHYLFLLQADDEILNCKPIPLKLPKHSFIRAISPLSADSAILLHLNPLMKGIDLQCTLTLYKLTVTKDGSHVLEKLTHRLIGERAIFSRVGLFHDKNWGHLYFYTEDDSYVLEAPRPSARYLYEGHIRNYSFRYGFFRYGNSIYTMSRISKIVGMDLIASQSLVSTRAN